MRAAHPLWLLRPMDFALPHKVPRTAFLPFLSPVMVSLTERYYDGADVDRFWDDALLPH